MRLTEHPTRTCRAILTRLRELGLNLPGPDSNYRIQPMHPTPTQREAGAWTWTLQQEIADRSVGAGVGLGGSYPASVCARPGAYLEHEQFGVSLYPSAEDERAYADKLHAKVT